MSARIPLRKRMYGVAYPDRWVVIKDRETGLWAVTKADLVLSRGHKTQAAAFAEAEARANLDEKTLNRLAQTFYDNSKITLSSMFDKPKVVAGLEAVFLELRKSLLPSSTLAVLEGKERLYAHRMYPDPGETYKDLAAIRNLVHEVDRLNATLSVWSGR